MGAVYESWIYAATAARSSTAQEPKRIACPLGQLDF